MTEIPKKARFCIKGRDSWSVQSDLSGIVPRVAFAKFADLVGQEHVTRTLKNALKEKRFSHAYLFSGPRGTGKTSTAKIFAKAVNCLEGPAPEPCNR